MDFLDLLTFRFSFLFFFLLCSFTVSKIDTQLFPHTLVLKNFTVFLGLADTKHTLFPMSPSPSPSRLTLPQPPAQSGHAPGYRGRPPKYLVDAASMRMLHFPPRVRGSHWLPSQTLWQDPYSFHPSFQPPSPQHTPHRYPCGGKT